MKRRIQVTFLLIFCRCIAADAQVSFATPNAAELGRYGQVPVELFNGLPQIGIPIYTIKNKDIEVPIQMSYYASGIKTEQHPTWVGLGWSLSCGGSITRIINGLKDETNKYDIMRETPYGFNNVEFGNFDASRYLAGDDWATTNGFNSFFPSSEVDPRTYLDGEPDEFIINAPGISASFYFYRDTQGELKLKVKSKDGKQIKVESSFSSNLTMNFAEYDPDPDNWPLHSSELQEMVLRPFYKFIVTTEDGKKYTFGGEVNAIDFYTSPTGKYLDTQPSSWYLTEIMSSPGTKVNFSYQRQGNPVVVNSMVLTITSYLPDSDIGSCLGCGDPDNSISYLIQHPVYLSAVTGSDGTNIQFSTSPSTELAYNVNQEKFASLINQSIGVNHTASQTMLNQSFWVKLDAIHINNHQRIGFSYLQSATQRLKLSTISFNDVSNNMLNKYSFTYDPRSLPVYNAKRSDNWGFYNNKYYQGVDYDQMYAYRSPDTALMKAEVLTSIKYPTGGSTSFEYESHNYSKIATQFPLFALQPAVGNAGGLRIKKITSKDGSAVNLPVVKEYSYLNQDNTSSGILSGIPLYKATGRQHVGYSIGGWSGLIHWRQSADYEQRYVVVSENYINTLGNTNGNHVTYSRVTETTAGAGRTVSKYRNHDNYPDSLPVNLYTNTDDQVLINKFTSKELERGLLTSTEVYNNNGNPVENVTYEYNSSGGRYNDFVRSISKNIISGVLEIPFIRMSAQKIYTFYPYLQKKTTKTYGLGGVGETTVVQDFNYTSPENLLKEEILTDSKGRAVTTAYKYPGNMLGNDPTGVYQDMYSKHMYSAVVEKAVSIPSRQLSYEKTNYFQPYTGIYVPQSRYSGVTSANAEPRLWYRDYDAQGNLLSMAKEKGPTTSYIWGYGKQYPIAETANGNKSEVYQQNFEEPELGLDFEANMIYDPARSHTGKYSGRLINGSSAELVSHSSKGLTVSLAAAKKFSYSGWIYSTGPSAQLFLFMMKSGEPGYFSYVDAVGTDTVNKWVYLRGEFLVPADVVLLKLRVDNNSAGTVWFDDLRIRPSDASMSTYTYEPLVGMTSAIDSRGQTVYYEYDPFQRLKYIRNQDWDIIKSYDYNYKP